MEFSSLCFLNASWNLGTPSPLNKMTGMSFTGCMCKKIKLLSHVRDYVIKWKHLPRNWPFVWGIHRPRWIPHTKASAMMFSLICVWINSWVNNCEAGDLSRYRGHYDVIVMCRHCDRYTCVQCCEAATDHLTSRLEEWKVVDTSVIGKWRP